MMELLKQHADRYNIVLTSAKVIVLTLSYISGKLLWPLSVLRSDYVRYMEKQINDEVVNHDVKNSSRP